MSGALWMNNIGFILIQILSMTDIALLGVLVMSSLTDIALSGVLVMSSLIVYERYSLVKCGCGCCLSYFFIFYFFVIWIFSMRDIVLSCVLVVI